MSIIPVLFARSDSVYKTIPGCDVYDIDRNALSCTSVRPGIYHPPCRAWGRLRHFSNPRPGEKELAIWSVDRIRKYGGVLEHPAYSSLWPVAGLPPAGGIDSFGGWTFPIDQHWFGHRAQKATFLYIVGISPAQIPDFPIDLSQPPCVLETRRKNNPRPSISRPEREHTPFQLALWLVDLVRLISFKQESCC
jgi:hypothetical protein